MTYATEPHRHRWAVVAVPVANAAALVGGIWFGPQGYASDPGSTLPTAGLPTTGWNLLPVVVLAGLLAALLHRPRPASVVVAGVASVLFSALTAWAVISVLRDPSGLAGLVFVFLPLPQLLVLAVAAGLAVLLHVRRPPAPMPVTPERHPPSVIVR